MEVDAAGHEPRNLRGEGDGLRQLIAGHPELRGRRTDRECGDRLRGDVRVEAEQEVERALGGQSPASRDPAQGEDLVE
jgi:hypothetical protein